MARQVFVESGRRGARKRWGPQRVVRLDELDPAVANVIRALLAAQSKAPVVSETSTEAPAQEVRRDARPAA